MKARGGSSTMSKASLYMVTEARCGSMLFTLSVSCLTYQTTPFFPFPSWVLQALAIITSQGHLCNGMLGLQTIAALTPTTSRLYVLILGVMAKPESILCINRYTKYTHWDSGREKLHAIRHSHQCYCKIMCAHFDGFRCVARI